jgi:hypothetical protein
MVERNRLEPTVESEMLDPVVERWSVEVTPDEVSWFRVDWPIAGPALPVPPMANPDSPPFPISWLLFGLVPMP